MLLPFFCDGRNGALVSRSTVKKTSRSNTWMLLSNTKKIGQIGNTVANFSKLSENSY